MKTYISLLIWLLGSSQFLSAQQVLVSDFNIEQEKTIIYGTLVKPAVAKKPLPVVLLIAGTGPMSRDLNLGLGRGSNAYKMLADSFAAAGIASVRFDKRGVGQSEAAVKHDSLLRFEDHITDVLAYLKKIRSDKQFGAVYLAGHSEGALIAMIAANRFPVQGVICMEMISERADIALKKQIDKNAPDHSELDTILSKLRAGQKVKVGNKYLVTIFRPSIQPYMISLFSYDPQAEIRNLRMPVLLINGGNDLQVPEENAHLLKTVHPDAAVKIIPAMNYVLKEPGEDRDKNVASYNEPDLPVSSALVQEMIRFCQARR
jgi:pimeloyl-ACP methyl ester carboxylesterase